MTMEHWLQAGLVGCVLLDVGLIWWLTRRPKPRRGGYIR